MRKNALLVTAALLVLTSCAENRVIDVKSSNDTFTMYKVPVVYGVGIAEASLDIGQSDVGGDGFGFAEYDPLTKRGTSSCLGNADSMWIHFPISWWYGQQNFDHKLHYHVMMVPAGYYAMVGRDASIEVHIPYEASPSVYFEVTNDGPQYLGDFWLMKSPNNIYSSPEMNLANPKLSTLPVEYHDEDAIKALQSFGIVSNGLKRVKMIPTTGGGDMPVCLP